MASSDIRNSPSGILKPAGSGGGIQPPAGQIDGTALDPLIVGFTDSNGVELGIGAVADGSLLARVGTLVVGLALGAGLIITGGTTLDLQEVSNTHRGAAPAHAGAADVGKALIATSTASGWGTDFGAQPLTTTGVLNLGATPRATVGDIRTKNAFSLFYRNFANTADLLGASFGNGGATNTITLGNFPSATASWVFLLPAGDGVLGFAAGTSCLTWNSTKLSTNLTNGTFDFLLAMQLQVHGITVISAPNSANANLQFFGAGANFQSGDKISFCSDRTAEPTSGTANGFFLYSQSGHPTWVTSAGNKLEWTSTTVASATAGASGATPLQVQGYLTISIDGNARVIPYYNP